MKIPEFPSFQSIDLSHRDEIYAHTNRYPSYSDFNFSSIFSWDTNADASISALNGNLAIRLADYITGQPVFSILGTNSIPDSVYSTLQYLKASNFTPELRLVPEVTAKFILEDSRFSHEEDRDNFDYVYSIDDLLTFAGNKYRAKRNFVNRFTRLYDYNVEELDLSRPEVVAQLEQVFRKWAEEKNADEADVLTEFYAMKRMLMHSNHLNLTATGLYSSGKLIGFTICECLNGADSILHFEKADYINYIGVYPFLMKVTAQVLSSKGRAFMNYEQDLGLSGLRKSKLSYQQNHFLKKYIIRLAEGN